ncbi:hypothetical protein CEQ21_05635 [Niallia circulans]|uniref:Uncharacterized protein n=1 Tax=Niallia circulans TaxID=1397 RepID=A0A553STS6_NIACI|nr:hypothetical protein [Niallia circulans]TRZ40393.1 hypothetical protein CEQ21_05635 [Niallia circulans]
MIASIVYIVLVVGGLVYLIKKKRDTEAKFPLKIIGYYILGVFAFKFNGIALPLGLIIYLLFFRPKVNADIKRQAAIFGFIIFIIVQWITPITVDMWESRTITIEHELESAYTIDFANENELVTKELKLEESNIKLDNFRMNYTQSGKITDLSWEMIGEADNEYNYYRIQYSTDKKEYEISKSHHEAWSQFVFLVDTKYYFGNLDLLDIQDITIAKGKFSSYKLFGFGERSQYGFTENEPHVISNGEIKKLDEKQLPVEAYYISTNALKKMSEETDEQGNIVQEGWEGTEFTDYLFDITPIEDEEEF